MANRQIAGSVDYEQVKGYSDKVNCQRVYDKGVFQGWTTVRYAAYLVRHCGWTLTLG